MIRSSVLLLSGLLLAATVGMPNLAVAETASEEIDKRAKNPDWWPAPGRDNKLTRHSPLKDINTDNVAKLQMAWSQSTGALRGHEGQPLFIEDVGGKPMMFFISGCPNMAQCNIAQGLDLSDPDNPKQIWNYVKKDDRDESAVPRACCDTVNRGASYADGKLVYGTLDGYVIALDAATGKEAWVVKHAWPEKGETITSAPLIAENLVVELHVGRGLENGGRPAGGAAPVGNRPLVGNRDDHDGRLRVGRRRLLDDAQEDGRGHPGRGIR